MSLRTRNAGETAAVSRDLCMADVMGWAGRGRAPRTQSCHRLAGQEASSAVGRSMAISGALGAKVVDAPRGPTCAGRVPTLT